MVKLNESGFPIKMKVVEKPILAIVYSTSGNFTDVLYDNDIWTVPTEKLNKGVDNAAKTDGSI